MLEISDLWAGYGEEPILKNLQLTLPEGDCAVLIGGNGAGKSTLLKVIAGSTPLQRGQIRIDHKPIHTQSPEWRARCIAQVLQDPRQGTLSEMTLEENLSLALLRGQRRTFLPAHTRARRTYFAQQLATLGMGLEQRLHEPASRLSGGQRQALSLLMALLAPSRLLLLDEITAALDPKMAQQILALATMLVGSRTTLLITHDMRHALSYGNRTLVLADGHITHEYTAAQREHLTASMLSKHFYPDIL